MDVIHTLIDMVYTKLFLFMQFYMKITLYTDVLFVLFSLTNLVNSVLNTLLLELAYPFP
jgi:hypothetical protein